MWESGNCERKNCDHEKSEGTLGDGPPAEQCLKTAHKLGRAGVEVNTIEESYNLQPPPIAIYPA